MLNIDKAIEILEYHEPSLIDDENPDIRLALKLGIEALKREKESKKGYYLPDLHYLPGETLE